MKSVEAYLKRPTLVVAIVLACGVLSSCGGGGSNSGSAAGSAATIGATSGSSGSTTGSTGTIGGTPTTIVGSTVVDTISNVVTGATNMIGNAASTVTNNLSNIATGVANAVSGVIGAVTSTVGSIASGVMSEIGVTNPATTVDDANAASPGNTKLSLEADAARLAKQATFGPTPAVVNRIISLGVSGWLDEQFASTASTYSDLTTPVVELTSCYHSDSCLRRNYGREQVAMRFYTNALSQPDQLRQRVALALSQLFVAANTSTNNETPGLAAYQQILLDGSFGNYRDLLTKVTLNCYMGYYLNLHANYKSKPNENYPREMMQLFSMGVNKLNMDGSRITDATGASIPNYTPGDVTGVARALTGWLCTQLDPTNVDSSFNMAKPMMSVASRHDVAAKSFLGVTVPAGTTPESDLASVIDAVFNNSSTAPFIARFLIQQLVMANPSPAYIGRVAAVFANNGHNVRGDLQAVVRAILTDAECRSLVQATTAGKVKEPVLLLTSIARAIGMKSDGYAFTLRDVQLGQPVFQAASVFSFYPPDFPLAQSQTLVSPASKLMTTGTTIYRSNLAFDWTINADANTSEFAPVSTVANSVGSTIDWSAWEAFEGDTDGMIDQIDLVLMNRSLSLTQKAALKASAEAIVAAPTTALLARKRAQTMLFEILSSPLFQVDR